MSKIDILPTGAALGADVRGVELRKGEVDDETFADVLAAWHEHLVLRFRDVEMTDAKFIAFSRRFGELDLAPVDAYGRFWIPEHPELAVISNVVEGGAPRGSLGNYESHWHTDMSYVDRPPKASLLYALEVPDEGGDTAFCNMYAAYEALPEDLKRRIQGLHCKHDASRNSVGQLREGFEEHYDDPRDIPGAVHALVRLHPETGRKALFLGRRHNAHIVELSWEESERLLDELWAHSVQDSFTWTQRWRVRDLIVWDNRCVMHRRDALDAAKRRVMHRTQVRDETPVREAAA